MANIKYKPIRDQLTGLKVLEKESMILLYTIPTIEEYKNNPIIEDEISFRETKIKIKNTSLHPASAAKLKVKYPELGIEPTIKYVIPEIEEEFNIILLPKSAKDLLLIYDTILKNLNKILINGPMDAAFWIALFCVYGPEFCAVYDEYISNPDSGIGLIEDIKDYIKRLIKMEEKPAIQGVTQNSTTFDIRATCHIIIISMNKTFIMTADRDKQIKTYLNNRKSAVYSSMGVPIGEICVKDDFFLYIGNAYRVLSRFKRDLFFFCFQNQLKPEFSTACVLLAHSAMTTIKAIVDFINTNQKTYAHAEPVILEEIFRFVNMVKIKKDKDGALWPYHRILYPADGDLNAANFPNLAVASIEFQKRFGSETFKFMVTPTVPTIPGIKDKATTLDTRDIYTEKQQVLSDEAVAGAKELGLDIHKLMGTRVTRETAGINELIRRIVSEMNP